MNNGDKVLRLIGLVFVAGFAIYGLLTYLNVQVSTSYTVRDVEWANRNTSGYAPSGFRITHDR